MYVLHVCFWTIAVALINQAHSNGESVTVYPVVYEDRENKQRKVVVFNYEHSLELKRASVLAPRLLLRDYTEDGVKDIYVNGAHYERHLYGNSEHGASLIVKPQRRGRYLIAGLINSTHHIEPIRNQIYFTRRNPHLISRIPTMKRDAHYRMIKAEARTNRNVSSPVARMQSIPLVVEVYLVSDYSHTMGLRKESLNALEYMTTYMYKVSLLLQQLKPPIRIALVAYQGTFERNVEYEKFTRTGDVDAHGTITKLRQYAAKSSSVHQSDLLVLITGTRMVDASAPAGAPDMLGLAPIKGICSQYSVALVKDTAGRYTGVHSTAHEMGHSFGCDHDGAGTSAKCPAADGYIMTPELEEKHSEEFSVCSHAVISKYVTSPAADCLRYAASMTVIRVFPRPIEPPPRGKRSPQN